MVWQDISWPALRFASVRSVCCLTASSGERNILAQASCKNQFLFWREMTLVIRLVIVATIAIVWGGLFRGSLAISQLDLGHWSALCGPWGCLPALAPLLSVHAMWLTLIGGASWLGRLAIPVLKDPRPWLGMLAASLVAMIALLGVEYARYIHIGGDGSEPIRFSLFKLVAWTDLPLIQIAICCLFNYCLTPRRLHQTSAEQATAGSAQTDLTVDI